MMEIFSNETALFLLDLTDRTPNMFDMTFPETYNLTNVKKEQIIALTVKKEWYEEGILQVRSPGENNIKVYNMERTLCDILRKRSGVDAGIIVEACKRASVMQLGTTRTYHFCQSIQRSFGLKKR